MSQEYSQFSPDEKAAFPAGQTLDSSYAREGISPGNSSPGSWSIVLPGTPDSLPQIREMITQAATRCGFAGEEIAKIEMAVDEACTNVIEHAYHAHNSSAQSPSAPGTASHLEFEVHAREHPDRLEITILDHSLHDFPVDEHAPEEIGDYFSENKRRGLGLFIIRSFVDDVQHRFVDGRGNELLLIKYFA